MPHNGGLSKDLITPQALATPDASEEPKANILTKTHDLRQKLVLIGPMLGMAAGLLLVGAGLASRIPSVRKQLEAGMAHVPAFNLLDQGGRGLQALSTVLVNLNGIVAGVVAGQPSMLLANLFQMRYARRLFTARNNDQLTVANFIQLALGGLYTVGFANEISNQIRKNREGEDAKGRVYNMSRFLSIFESDVSLPQKVVRLATEIPSMAWFVVMDHVNLLKDVARETQGAAKKLAGGFGYVLTGKHADPDDTTAAPGFGARVVDTVKAGLQQVSEPSAYRSRLAVLSWYIGALPVVLLGQRHIANSPVVKRLLRMEHPEKLMSNRGLEILRFFGGIAANLTTFAVANNRSDWRGQAPVIGAPMSVIGTAINAGNMYTQDFWRGIGVLGEAINNLLFSEVAVDGLKVEQRNKPAEPVVDKAAPLGAMLPGLAMPPLQPLAGGVMASSSSSLSSASPFAAAPPLPAAGASSTQAVLPGASARALFHA